MDEPILRPNDNRFVMFPIHHDDAWKLFKKMQSALWVAEELSFKDDRFEQLTDPERHFITHILAFFAASDGLVIENIDTNFQDEIQVPEIRACYSLQAYIEQVHSESYSLLIDRYITDDREKKRLFTAIQHFPAIKQKAQWAMKYMNKSRSFAERLVAFACVEHIHFSGSFCAIFYFKKRQMLPGLSLANEFIARDERLHVELACLVYNKLVHKLNREQVLDIVRDAVAVEKTFINDALPCRLIGMNAKLMGQYIEYVGDLLLVMLGYKRHWGVSQPFSFMEMICLEGKPNFFETRSSQYAVDQNTPDNSVFDLKSDF